MIPFVCSKFSENNNKNDFMDFSDSFSSSTCSLSSISTSSVVGKKEQIEIINKLRNSRQAVVYLIPSAWKKAWFLYCLDEKNEISEPGKIQTFALVDTDWIDDATVLQHPKVLPVMKEVPINAIPEGMFRRFVEWYGLDGPEIIRFEADNFSMHSMLVSCQGKTLKFCVPKTITKQEFYQLVTEAFQLPDVDNILSIDQTEDDNVIALNVKIRMPRVLEPIDWDALQELPLSGIIGLGNIGNTCYMASALQALSQSKALIMPTLAEKQTLGNISYEFFTLARSLWTGNHSSLSELKDALARKELRFASYSQQDSQELLAVLLDHINEETRVKSRARSIDAIKNEEEPTMEEAWQSFVLRNNSLVTDVFGGLLKSQVKCVECAAESTTFDPFLFLSLPIPTSATPKVALNIVGLGKQQLKSTGHTSIGSAKREMGFPCAVVLADSGKYVQVISDNDPFSLYVDRDDDFFDFKRKRGQIFVYPNVESESVNWVSFYKSSFIIGSEYFGFPIHIPEATDNIESVKAQLSTRIPIEVAQVLEIKQTGTKTFSAKVPSDHVQAMTDFFDKLLPESPQSPDVLGCVTLDDCLSAFEQDEYLSADVGWKCPKCKRTRPALKFLKLANSPKYSLMVHLKRFAYNSHSSQKMGWFSGLGRKVTTQVTFPQYWQVKGVIYELYAVIEHYGNLFGGHYTCAARNFLTGEWHRYDDSSVREIDLSSVLSCSQSSAYVLFYERKQ